MSKLSLSRLRAVAFTRQGGRCYYCAVPIWLIDAKSFAQKHPLTQRQTKWLQCTAEHLIARQDGGTDSPDNIAAACLYCNQHRHRCRVAPSPSMFRQRVRLRMARGGWHGLRS
jgi:hypothetical protein